MQHPSQTELTHFIKESAKAIGFSNCGMAKAQLLTKDLQALQKHTQSGYHADMDYLCTEQERRCNPKLINPAIQSVIVVTLPYYPEVVQNPDTIYRISKYAFSTDYHFVMKDLLAKLQEAILQMAKPEVLIAYSDTGPVLEKAWARKAGLGSIGKNTLLLTKQGSFNFIGVLLTDLLVDYDTETTTDVCKQCSKCIDACPSGALVQGRVIDANKCISYQTVENKHELPKALNGKFENYIFGCDICQDICPINKKQPFANQNLFKPNLSALNLSTLEWEELTQETFAKTFAKTAIKRRKLLGIQKNIAFVKTTAKT